MDIETPSGEVVSLDDEDYESLQWPSISMSGNGYPQVFHDGKVRTLHSVLMGVGDGTGHSVLVDHIDRNKLNNRRSNLRLVNPTESNLNRKPRARKYDLPPGVYPNKKGYMVRISRYYVRHNLGTYSTVEQAVEVAEKFRKEND